MNPDYAPENEMRRAEVIGCKVQYFHRNRTKVKKCWLSFWFAEYQTKQQAKERADRWVHHAIPPLSSRKPPKPIVDTKPAELTEQQLFLPMESQMHQQCVL